MSGFVKLHFWVWTRDDNDTSDLCVFAMVEWLVWNSFDWTVGSFFQHLHRWSHQMNLKKKKRYMFCHYILHFVLYSEVLMTIPKPQSIFLSAMLVMWSCSKICKIEYINIAKDYKWPKHNCCLLRWSTNQRNILYIQMLNYYKFSLTESLISSFYQKIMCKNRPSYQVEEKQKLWWRLKVYQSVMKDISLD